MSLKKNTLSGFIWTSLGTVGNGLTTILVTVVLARLLTPNDFATVELLAIFIAVSNIFIESGFSQAIIRDDAPTQNGLSTVFFFNLIVSVLFYIVLYIAAPFLASFFNTPELVSISRVAFLVIIFNSLTIIQNSLLSRELKFKELSRAAVIGIILAGTTAVVMAFLGCGIWAIVANLVLTPLFRSVILWIKSTWRPTLVFELASLKKYFNFGGFLLLQGIMDAITNNIISLFIGKLYTKNDLGYFSQGRKLDSYIITPFSSVLEKVTYPILSQIKNENERMRSGIREITGITIFVLLPLTLFFCIYGEEFTIFLYGEKWLPSAVYLQIMMLTAIFLPLQRIYMNVIMAKGKTKQMFYFAIIKQSTRMIVLIALVVMKVNVFWLAVGFAFTGALGSILYIALGMHIIKYSLTSLIKDSLKTIVAVAFSILAGKILTDYMALSPFVTLIVGFLIAASVYITISIYIDNQWLSSSVKLVYNKKK